MKRLLVFAALFLAIALAGTLLHFRGKQYQVIITQQQIDEALRARFPRTETYLVFFDITYSNPRVTLLPDLNRIQVGLDAELDIRIQNERKNLGGTALATAALYYQAETREFFLTEPEINQLAIASIPQQHLDKATTFATKALQKSLQKFPVYTLRATDARTATARLLLKNVQVKGSEIHVTLGL